MIRTFVFALLMALSTFVGAADAVEQPEVLPPDKWPTAVPEVVADLVRRLPESDKERLRSTPKKDLIKYHHGFGTGIRNYYGLWRGNKSLINSACGKPCHPDDASMVIIEALWSSLQR